MPPEETFESILRAEMQSMKTGFEKKIMALNDTLAKQTDDYKKKMRQKENELESLKQTNEMLQKRFKEITSSS